MEYLSYKVKDANFSEQTPLRRAFRKHLNKVANALHAIEWNDSGDGHDKEDELILECIGTSAVLDQAIEEAISDKEELAKIIAQSKTNPPTQELIDEKESL